MRSVSLAFREAINRGFAPYFRATAVFPNGYLTDAEKKSVTLELVGKIPQEDYDADYVKRWGYISDFMEDTIEYQSGTSSSGNFDVGSAVISELSFTLNNNNGKFDHLDFTGAYLMPYIGVRKMSFQNYLFTEAGGNDEDEAHIIGTEDDNPMTVEMENGSNRGKVEWLYMGTFYFVSHKQTGYTIVCETYDRLKFLDEYFILADDKISFPITVHDLVTRIADKRGIVLADEKFTGYDIVLPAAPTNDITERQALSYAVQLCGCYARMGLVGSNDRLLIKWYDFDSAFTSKRRFSHSLETKDVTITGVRVHDINDSDVSYLYPEDSEKEGEAYYTIDISENPWIVTDSEDGSVKSNLVAVAQHIWSQIGGMTFTPGSETIFTDPSIEAGDVLKVYGDNTKEFHCFIITNLDMKLGVTETITCDAQTPETSDLRQTVAQTALNQAKKKYTEQLTRYQTMNELFSRLAKESLGTYQIEELLDDGSKITYYSTVTNLQNATAQNPAIVWRLSADAIQVCDNYVYGSDDNKWTGYTADGRALVNTLTAIGLNADWIKAGAISIRDDDGNETFYADTQTGEVRIRANSFSLEGQTVKQMIDDANAEQDETINQSIGDTEKDIKDYTDKQVQDALKSANDKATELANNASDLARVAQETADGKITTYYSADAPKDNLSVGDLWMDTDNNNNLSRWDGTNWVDVTDKGIASAMRAANTAQATADGKVVTYAQTDAPLSSDNSPLTIGDLWLDTDDNNHPYRWDGTSWVEIRDGFIQEAADTAETNSKKYADDSLSNYDKQLDQLAVFNKLTDNGTKKGIYLDNGELYINATYLKTGILSDGVGNNYWNLNTGEFKLSYANRISHVNYPFDNNGWWRTSGAVDHYKINDDGSITVDGTDISEYTGDFVGIHLTTYAATSYKIVFHIKFDTAYTPLTDEQSTIWAKNRPVIIWFPYNDGKGNTNLAHSAKQYNEAVAEGFEEDVSETFDKPYETLASGRNTNISGTDTLRFYLLPGCKYTISNVSVTSAVSDATVGALNAADTAETNSKAYADSKDTALNQQEIFNRLTNNGESEGIYLQDGHVYINGSMIKANSISASSIDATSLHVNAANIDGTLSANKISGGTIDANNVAISNLVVGNNVSMGPNATISWSNVSNHPTNISSFNNDSGYQNAAQVTTISNNCISTAWINANKVCIYDNNGTYHGTLGSWGTFNDGWAGVMFNTNLSVKGLFVDGDTNLGGRVWTGMERNYQGIYSDSEIMAKSWICSKGGFKSPYADIEVIDASRIDAADGYRMSDRRMKHDIKDLPTQKAYDFIMGLRPVSYIFNEGDQSIKHGFIAQEVQEHEYDGWEVVKTMPAIKSEYADKKEHLSLSYEGLIADLVSVVQQQEKKIEALEKRIV